MHPLALSYEGSQLPADVIDLVDVLELTPETIAVTGSKRPILDREQVACLRELNLQMPFTIHGASLSIGSAGVWNEAYLQLLDQCFDAFPNILWHGEYLGITRLNGAAPRTMRPVPYTHQSLDRVSSRVDSLIRRYEHPFVLEPVANLLPPRPGDMPEWSYLNALTSLTGGRLLLNADSLVCDACNHGRDLDAFLRQVDLRYVRELRIAGIDRDTWPVAARILQGRRGGLLITFEALRAGSALVGSLLGDALRTVRDWVDGVCDEGARPTAAVA